MAAIRLRASIGADAEAALLGRGEGLEQAGADEIGRHAAAAVDHLDRRHRRRSRRRAGPTGASGRAGVDRVLDEVGRAPARAASGSASATSAGLAGDADRMRAPLRRGDRVEHRLRSRPRAAARHSRAAPGESRASRSFIFVTELCRVAIMSARNSGLSACRSALRVDQAELADQILDVVHDEGEAAVELVEALRVGERLLAARLGEIAGGLDAGGAEQVEILPVQRAAGTAGCSRMTRPTSRPSWISGTPAQALVQRRRASAGTATRLSPVDQLPVAHPRRNRRHSRSARRKRSSASAPSPAAAAVVRVQFQRPAGASRRCSSASSSRPPGAPPMSASALTMRSSSGGAVLARAPTVSVKRSHSWR